MSKVVLITGTSTGFGRLAAERLARRGHTVYATMRGVKGANAAAADELAALARAEGLNLVPLELDVTDTAGVERAAAEVIAREGRIDVVVNNAGVGAMGLAETFTPEDVGRLFDVNLLGPHRVNRAVLPHLRAAGTGRIIHLSSIAGRLAIPAMGPYSATKFALEAMAESLRLELAPLGVEITLIEPGAFPTAILGKIGTGSDTGRAAGYGPAASLPDQLGAGLGEALSGPDAPDPGTVADVIVAQVEAAPGTVPFRTTVGDDAAPVTALNRTAAVAHDELLRAFGLAALAETAAVANPA